MADPDPNRKMLRQFLVIMKTVPPKTVRCCRETCGRCVFQTKKFTGCRLFNKKLPKRSCRCQECHDAEAVALAEDRVEMPAKKVRGEYR